MITEFCFLSWPCKNKAFVLSFVKFYPPYYVVIKKTALNPPIYAEKKFIPLLYICRE